MANSYRTPLLPFPPKRQERFWSKVSKSDSDHCWEWQGGKDDKGYGSTDIRTKTVKAHRVAFALTYNREPVQHVLHRCDNPPCCNPAHLFEGTQADNIRDRDSKGRGVSLRGEQHYNHKLTWKDVEYIRSLPGPVNISRIAASFKINRKTIREIRSGKIWKPKP